MEKIATVQKRILYMDMLRIFASISVILIHSATFVHDISLINTKQWWLANVLNSISRWCVPIFFMLSGATLLDYWKKYSTTTFYKKRFLRVAIPFAVWTGIYVYWLNARGYIEINGLRDLLRFTISGPAVFHLWFFYSLLGLYLVVPILSILTKDGSKKLVYFLISICIINNQILPLISKFTSIGFGFSIPLAGQYIDYFLLGWVLKDIIFNKNVRYIFYVLGVISIVVTIVSSYWLSVRINKADLYFMDYETITTLLSSLAVFVFVKNIDWEKLIAHKTILKIVNLVANASFGIYLIHILAQSYLVEIFNFSGSPIKFMTLGALATYFTSLIIVLILKKIPLIKNIVP